jgi:hypothetical protein
MFNCLDLKIIGIGFSEIVCSIHYNYRKSNSDGRHRLETLQNLIIEHNSDQRETLRRMIGPVFKSSISEARTVGY